MKLTQTVGARDAGRLLKYFIRGNMGVSYHQFASMKQRGGVRVNGDIQRADYMLHEGDVVELTLTDAPKYMPEMDDTPVDIAYEDDDIIIVDKPAPLACQRSIKREGYALENRLAHYFRHEPDYIFRPVNRLDKGTSGLMAVAKHAHAQMLLQRALHTDSFEREYLAIVEGELTGEGVIDLPIAKLADASVKRVIDYENGKPCETHYAAQGVFGGYSLVRLRLKTGRTHQIRAHMLAIGHAVAGDFLYGHELPELPGRFALHSTRIALLQPMTGTPVVCVSELPDELKAFIDAP